MTDAWVRWQDGENFSSVLLISMISHNFLGEKIFELSQAAGTGQGGSERGSTPRRILAVAGPAKGKEKEIRFQREREVFS